MAEGGSGGGRDSGVALVAHAIAAALDDHRLGVMQQAVEQGGDQRAVIVEDFRPLFEGAVLCTVRSYAEKAI